MIARADGSVLYNFAVAVDDADMGITDVVRGDDHLSNTPRQLLVLAALGEPAPRYAHLPLLHGPDGKKLSKRHGAASVQELRDAGYLPAAVRNYLALLGWGTEDDETIMSTDELVATLLDRARRTGRGDLRREEAALAQRPLHARAAGLERLRGRARGRTCARTDPAAAERVRRGAPEASRREACSIVREKAQTLNEIWPLIAFLFTDPPIDEKAWSKVMKPAVGRAPQRGCREVDRRGRAVRRRDARAGPARADRGARARARQGAAADPGRDHRLDDLAGALRVACGARARALASSGSTVRWPASRAESGGPVRTAPTAAKDLRQRSADQGATGQGSAQRRTPTDTDMATATQTKQRSRGGDRQGRSAPVGRIRRRQHAAGARRDRAAAREADLAGERLGDRDRRGGRVRHRRWRSR